MATCAFLLYPQQPILEEFDEEWVGTVQSWIALTDAEWCRLWEKLPKRERASVPRWLGGQGVTTNAMAATRRNDPRLKANALEWVHTAFDRWSAEGRQGSPSHNDLAACHEALGLNARISIPNLIYYRGGYTRLATSKLKRGGSVGFLCNKGESNEFDFGEADSIERSVFLEISRAYGGDHLAVWTFGQAVNILLARSETPGRRPKVYGPLSLRLTPPIDTARPGRPLDMLRHWFAGSGIDPDWKRIEAQLAAHTISVSVWFEAFGIAGARDPAAPDTGALWNYLQEVSLSLLDGIAPDKQKLRRVNEILSPAGKRDLLKAKPAKPGKGENARAVANAVYNFTEALGTPESSPWAERRRAADFYWDITDGPALHRLTLGTDSKGFGRSAALARLLTHYPIELICDPIFLSLAALQCEAANGHAYVVGLQILAESVQQTRVIAVAFPIEARQRFRQAFGIEAEKEDQKDSFSSPWAGEAFLEAPPLLKGDLSAALRRWFAKEKSNGVLTILDQNGGVALEFFKSGTPVPKAEDLSLSEPDQEALSQAAHRLDARSVFPALGLGDLLAPGEWTEGSYGGRRVESSGQRGYAHEALASPCPVQMLSELNALARLFPYGMRYRGEEDHYERGITSLCLTIPTRDESFLRALSSDLKASRMVDNYGDVWLADGQLWAFTRSSLDPGLFACTLADLPDGSRIALDFGRKEQYHFELRRG